MQPTALRSFSFDPTFSCLDDFTRHIRSAPALLLQDQALHLSVNRIRRRILVFEAARGFAPAACREAVRLWEAEAPSAVATRQLTYWRGVCEFIPSDAAAPTEGASENSKTCPISAEDHRLYMNAQELERNYDTEAALALYAALCERHPFAAARITCLRPRGALEAWRRYRGRVNEAVAAMQCYALCHECCLGELRENVGMAERASFAWALRFSVEWGHTPTLGLWAVCWDHLHAYAADRPRAEFLSALLKDASWEDVWAELAYEALPTVSRIPRLRALSAQENMASLSNNQLPHKSVVHGVPCDLSWLMHTARAPLPSPLPLSAVRISLHDLSVTSILTQPTRPAAASASTPVTFDADEDFSGPAYGIASAAPAASAYANVATNSDPVAAYANADPIADQPTPQFYANSAGDEPSVPEAPLTRASMDSYARSCWYQYLARSYVTELRSGAPTLPFQWAHYACSTCLQMSRSTHGSVCVLCHLRRLGCEKSSVTLDLRRDLPGHYMAMSRLMVPYDLVWKADALGRDPAPITVSFEHFCEVIPYLSLIQSDVLHAALQLTQTSYFYGRISKEAAEALVRQRGGAYLLRWSASMAGVYFIVVSSRDAASVRHIQLARAGDAADRHVRSVAVRVPVAAADESGKKGYEIRLYDHLFAAVEALREPYHLRHPLSGSPYAAVCASAVSKLATTQMGL